MNKFNIIEDLNNEQRELLIKEISYRLPYNTKFASFSEDFSEYVTGNVTSLTNEFKQYGYTDIELRIDTDEYICTIVDFCRPILRRPETLTLLEIKELDEVMEIYAYARRFMAEHGNPDQWGSKYPPGEMLLQDIAREKLFLRIFFSGAQVEVSPEQMENLLFICPTCGAIDQIHSHGNTVTCGDCGASFRYDEYGMLQNAVTKTQSGIAQVIDFAFGDFLVLFIACLAIFLHIVGS